MKKTSLLWIAFVPFVVAASPAAEPPPPVPLPAACPAVATSMPLIPGLMTGQAIAEGETTTTLRFSSEVRACGEWSNEVKGNVCLDSWSFRITIPQRVLAPGVYELAQVGATFGELVVKSSPDPDRGCSDFCNTSVKGIGSISLESSRATLVIDSSDDGCITGTIRDLYDPSFSDTPSFNGAFFAVRCTS
jgi:hypothetical protein